MCNINAAGAGSRAEKLSFSVGNEMYGMMRRRVEIERMNGRCGADRCAAVCVSFNSLMTRQVKRVVYNLSAPRAQPQLAYRHILL